MSDEWITPVEQVVAEAVAPFVEMVGDAVEAATAVLEALRKAGFDVYRPERSPSMADFDRDATKEALDMWGRFGPPRPGAGTPLSDLNQIVQAARWAVQITEGDGGE